MHAFERADPRPEPYPFLRTDLAPGEPSEVEEIAERQRLRVVGGGT